MNGKCWFQVSVRDEEGEIVDFPGAPLDIYDESESSAERYAASRWGLPESRVRAKRISKVLKFENEGDKKKKGWRRR